MKIKLGKYPDRYRNNLIKKDVEISLPLFGDRSKHNTQSLLLGFWTLAIIQNSKY
jgi:hypothetical protein